MKIIKFNNGRYSEPPIGRYIRPVGIPGSHRIPDGNNVHHKTKFKDYEIPQFDLHIKLRPPGDRQPSVEANILGRIKYILQLNGFRGDRGKK